MALDRYKPSLLDSLRRTLSKGSSAWRSHFERTASKGKDETRAWSIDPSQASYRSPKWNIQPNKKRQGLDYDLTEEVYSNLFQLLRNNLLRYTPAIDEAVVGIIQDRNSEVLC